MEHTPSAINTPSYPPQKSTAASRKFFKISQYFSGFSFCLVRFLRRLLNGFLIAERVNVKKLHPDAKLPTYAHHGDAGFDLYAIESVTILAGARVLVGTGVAMEIPDGYAGLIWDKSGLATGHGLKTLGGVIDAPYRGEIKVGVVNLSDEDYTITVGHKIAQMIIQKVERAEIKEVAELSESSRGHGGFGSTGK